jgi:tRNA G18 (ribose-2'-O)-methylase SpoU
LSQDARPPRRRLDELDAIREAFDRNASIRSLLCRTGDLSGAAMELVERARALGIPVLVESEREMRRMSVGDGASELLAIEADGDPTDLDELMAEPGLVFVLVGLRYPANVGFILRSAEVAGAAGVVVANAWQGSELAEALRVGMRADRFLPVFQAEAEAALAAARRSGRRIVAIETGGERAPWDVDLRHPSVVLVGGEAAGIPESLLAESDVVVRIPTRGIIPSYNVQAAVAIALGEWLRQSSR